MSPYETSATEVVTTFGNTDRRRTILRGWLSHRSGLRAAGFKSGFQWLDGSFTEDKVPNDLDVLSFLNRPAGATSGPMVAAIMQANPTLFRRSLAKTTYKLDIFNVDMNGSIEAVIDASRYLLGLFSHRRSDFLWKGMLKVRLEDVNDDAAAILILGPESSTASAGVTP